MRRGARCSIPTPSADGRHCRRWPPPSAMRISHDSLHRIDQPRGETAMLASSPMRFRLMRDPELLLRAAAVWLPQAARERLGQAWKTAAWSRRGSRSSLDQPELSENISPPRSSQRRRQRNH